MINKFYFDNKVLNEISKEFKKEQPNKVVLNGFFDEERYNFLKNELNKSKKKHVRVPDRYSYNLIESKEIKKLFSLDFDAFISRIIGKEVRVKELKIKEFGWKDYTLIHDSEKIGSQMSFFFFVPSVKEWDYFWGGNKVYYVDEGKEENLVFVPSENALCLIDKRKNDHGFLQYLNNYVGKEKLVVVEGVLE